MPNTEANSDGERYSSRRMVSIPGGYGPGAFSCAYVKAEVLATTLAGATSGKMAGAFSSAFPASSGVQAHVLARTCDDSLDVASFDGAGSMLFHRRVPPIYCRGEKQGLDQVCIGGRRSNRGSCSSKTYQGPVSVFFFFCSRFAAAAASLGDSNLKASFPSQPIS